MIVILRFCCRRVMW